MEVVVEVVASVVVSLFAVDFESVSLLSNLLFEVDLFSVSLVASL